MIVFLTLKMKTQSKADIEFEKLNRANHREVLKAYGKKRAKIANYGWATSVGGYCSKVYGIDGFCCMLVTTERRDGKIVHLHEPYE
jgi:hypothetical protein